MENITQERKDALQFIKSHVSSSPLYVVDAPALIESEPYPSIRAMKSLSWSAGDLLRLNNETIESAGSLDALDFNSLELAVLYQAFTKLEGRPLTLSQFNELMEWVEMEIDDHNLSYVLEYKGVDILRSFFQFGEPGAACTWRESIKVVEPLYSPKLNRWQQLKLKFTPSFNKYLDEGAKIQFVDTKLLAAELDNVLSDSGFFSNRESRESRYFQLSKCPQHADDMESECWGIAASNLLKLVSYYAVCDFTGRQLTWQEYNELWRSEVLSISKTDKEYIYYHSTPLLWQDNTLVVKNNGDLKSAYYSLTKVLI